MGTVDQEKMESIIRRVKKALALAGNNPSEKEAQSAMMMAQKLMAQYNLDLQEIGDQNQPEGVTESEIYSRSRLDWWQRSLVGVIASNFRCRAYFNKTFEGRSLKRVQIMFIGFPEDVVIAKEVYLYANSYMRYNAEQYLRNRSDYKELSKKEDTYVRNSWTMGFLHGLSENFKKQVEQNQWGLVVVTPEAVVKAFESKELTTARSSKISTLREDDEDSSAYGNGYRDGLTFDSGRKRITEQEGLS